MQPNPTSWLTVLNKLIVGCRQGQEGYRIASKEIQDTDLKYLFSSYALQRAKFALELEEALAELTAAFPGGGESIPSRPGWFELKDILAERDDRDILRGCLQGEEEVLRLYQEAEGLDDGNGIRDLIVRQKAEVEAAFCRLSALRFLSDSRDAEGF